VYAVEDQVARLLDRAAAGSPVVEFFGSRLTLPVERRFADVDAVQRWVDAVLALEAVAGQWPGTPACTVRTRRGPRAAVYEPPGTIAVPVGTRWALRELVLSHELAHHLQRHGGGGLAPAHGAAFQDTFAALVDLVIGPEVGLLLRAGFVEAGVR
jgi:putative metallohydrolase (TIGR04338 family)